ncbi:hypothetical protein DID88_005678 [Monilinia fructigena]|uniref:RNase H type-1 domain-containing protein n=1 Tax=Monilinia fructigena TaxID=38457 RepID=A0A395J0G8_9HELO|nr:hypothetical protein DID88_005678 [Monilinia fructigena]
MEENVTAITQDVRRIEAWGLANKVAFAPEKLEMMHFTHGRHAHAPEAVISPTLTIQPTTSAPGDTKQPALRWLGVWLDRKLTFKRHIAERVEKARKVALHIKHLANTVHGPPAASLRKATITCVMPSLLYGAEAWYPGRTRLSTGGGHLRGTMVSTRMGSRIAKADKVINLATKGVLPVWRTTPIVANLRDAGLPPCEVALEHIRINMALRLRRLDVRHPLTMRLTAPGHRTQNGTRLRSADRLLPGAPRPILSPPHYTPGCRTDPTQGIDKETAAASFNDWWNALPPNTVTIFSDGSESYDDAATGKGAINTLSHVFDAEAIGALKGLQKALTLPSNADTQRWLCIDSTSVIWCKRANASDTSQWAFLESHRLIDRHAVNIRWSPGHQGITGNEAADSLADAGAKSDIVDPGPTAQPTISGIGSIARSLAHNVTSDGGAKTSQRQLCIDYLRCDPGTATSRLTINVSSMKTQRLTVHAVKAKTPEHLVSSAAHYSIRRYPPLVVDGISIESAREKAEALFGKSATSIQRLGRSGLRSPRGGSAATDAPVDDGHLARRDREEWQGGDAGYTGRAGRVRCAATQKAFGTDAKAGLAYGAAPANQLVPSGSQGQGPAGGHVHRRIEDAMRNPTRRTGSARPEADTGPIALFTRLQDRSYRRKDERSRSGALQRMVEPARQDTITVFSDGTEQYKDGAKLVGYGYAVYRGQTLARTGSGAINSISHVFDAEGDRAPLKACNVHWISSSLQTSGYGCASTAPR